MFFNVTFLAEMQDFVFVLDAKHTKNQPFLHLLTNATLRISCHEIL